MIYIQQRIRRRHVTPATWNELSNDAWAQVAAYWHAKVLPKHFEVGAYREYRYQARTRKHEARKERKFGHRRPLVYSGALERQVLRAREVRTIGGAGSRSRATGAIRGGGATIKVQGPAYLRPNRATGRMPDFRAEIAAFSSRDKKAMAVELNKALQAGLRAARFPEEDVRP